MSTERGLHLIGTAVIGHRTPIGACEQYRLPMDMIGESRG